MSEAGLSFIDDFDGQVLGEVPFEHALLRVVAFSSSRRCGFVGYAVAAHQDERPGVLDVPMVEPHRLYDRGT